VKQNTDNLVQIPADIAGDEHYKDIYVYLLQNPQTDCRTVATNVDRAYTSVSSYLNDLRDMGITTADQRNGTKKWAIHPEVREQIEEPKVVEKEVEVEREVEVEVAKYDDLHDFFDQNAVIVLPLLVAFLTGLALVYVVPVVYDVLYDMGMDFGLVGVGILGGSIGGLLIMLVIGLREVPR